MHPAPLVPSEVDLRDFAFMPLDVLRLRDSDISTLAKGEEFKAAVLLWCASWHQLPAASVPDDDRWLAKHSGAGSRWPKVRDMALRGFKKCSDGRLYHEVVAEKAMDSWAKKLAQRARTKAATEARERQRNGHRYADCNGHRNDERDEDPNVVQGTVKGRDSKGNILKPDLEVSISPTRELENVKTVLKKIPLNPDPETLERNRRIANAVAENNIELAVKIREGTA